MWITIVIWQMNGHAPKHLYSSKVYGNHQLSFQFKQGVNEALYDIPTYLCSRYVNFG